MSDKNKVVSNDEALKNKELDLEELKDVSGGALKDISFSKTVDISKNTKSKIG